MNEALKTFIIAALAATVLVSFIGGIFVFRQSYRRMVKEDKHFLDVGGYVAFLFPVLIAIVALAATGVEAAYKVVSDGATGLAWLFGSILGTLVGLPQIGKFSKGDTNVSIEKVETLKRTETGGSGGSSGPNTTTGGGT